MEWLITDFLQVIKSSGCYLKSEAVDILKKVAKISFKDMISVMNCIVLDFTSTNFHENVWNYCSFICLENSFKGC